MKRLVSFAFFILAVAGQVSGQDALVIEERFLVDVSSPIAWNVLTDYDHISEFEPSMEFSRIKERTDDGWVVDQRASGKFFFLSKNALVSLKIHEQPYELIKFEDILRKDFDVYIGSWKIEQTQPGLLIHYKLQMKSRFSIPGFIKRRVMRRNVHELLENVRSEMLKRKGKPL